MEFLFNFSPIPTRYTLDGNIYEVDTPSISYRAPYILHSGSTVHACNPGGYRRFALNVHPCILAEYGGICDMGRLRDRTECLLPLRVEQIQKFEPILDRLQTKGVKPLPRHAWIGLFSALLTEIDRLIPEEESTGKHGQEIHPYIQELLRFVVDNPGENLSTQALAEKFFVSRAKLCADFRAATRISLHEYVTAIRIAHAKLWLAEDMPLSLIAERCGFSQESSFIYMFRRRTGMTPGEWRERKKIPETSD